MSGHLIGCVKDVEDLGKSHKLALVAFADSADDRTHIGFPGYEGVMAWASCSRSRAAELIADLVEAGYLAPHRRACTGRRAEYVVFPNGCCEVHRVPVAEAEPDLDAIAAAAGVSIDQARAMLTALASGSEFSDPLSGDRSENSDPVGDEGSRVRDLGLTGPGSRTRTDERVQSGSGISDPFTTSTTPPLPPETGGASAAAPTPPATPPAAAGGGCSKPGAVPHPNCRGCGTTNRQQQLADAAAKSQRLRVANQAAIEAERAKTAAGHEAAEARRAARAATRNAGQALQTTGRTR